MVVDCLSSAAAVPQDPAIAVGTPPSTKPRPSIPLSPLTPQASGWPSSSRRRSTPSASWCTSSASARWRSEAAIFTRRGPRVLPGLPPETRTPTTPPDITTARLGRQRDAQRSCVHTSFLQTSSPIIGPVFHETSQWTSIKPCSFASCVRRFGKAQAPPHSATCTKICANLCTIYGLGA